MHKEKRFAFVLKTSLFVSAHILQQRQFVLNLSLALTPLLSYYKMSHFVKEDTAYFCMELRPEYCRSLFFFSSCMQLIC